jgi:hypothetical protein
MPEAFGKEKGGRDARKADSLRARRSNAPTGAKTLSAHPKNRIAIRRFRIRNFDLPY